MTRKQKPVNAVPAVINLSRSAMLRAIALIALCMAPSVAFGEGLQIVPLKINPVDVDTIAVHPLLGIILLAGSTLAQGNQAIGWIGFVDTQGQTVAEQGVPEIPLGEINAPPVAWAVLTRASAHAHQALDDSLTVVFRLPGGRQSLTVVDVPDASGHVLHSPPISIPEQLRASRFTQNKGILGIRKNGTDVAVVAFDPFVTKERWSLPMESASTSFVEIADAQSTEEGAYALLLRTVEPKRQGIGLHFEFIDPEGATLYRWTTSNAYGGTVLWATDSSAWLLIDRDPGVRDNWNLVILHTDAPSIEIKIPGEGFNGGKAWGRRNVNSEGHTFLEMISHRNYAASAAQYLLLDGGPVAPTALALVSESLAPPLYTVQDATIHQGRWYLITHSPRSSLPEARFGIILHRF